jgi:5'(3')-deoxyribonucleotidase
MRKRTFIDLDGVVANWEKSAMVILGANEEKYIPLLKEGNSLRDYFPNQWEVLDSKTEEFWLGLEKLPWADELIELALKYGDVAFLTSGGNVYERTNGVADAAKGKTIWVDRHFSKYGIPLIITKHKNFCAYPNSILIDDTLKNIEKFEEGGGTGYHFPQIYKLLEEDIDIKQVFGELELLLKQ